MSAKVLSAPETESLEKALAPEDFDRLFAPLLKFSNLALAISGGADSVCLLVGLASWRKRVNWTGTCEVLVMDHGLRAESAEEARFVEDLCASHGFPCRAFRWHGEKPGHGLQDAARNARYQLFGAHMKTSGAEALVLAHHQDDQAETFLDRLTRGSGVTGLSGMAADEANGPFGLRLLRPLLDVPKKRLAATLLAEGVSWREDPSNADPKYKRSRLRQILSLLAEEGLTAERISQTVRHMRRARTALETALAHIFLTDVEEHPAGPLRLSLGRLRGVEEELRLRLIALLANRVSGGIYPPRFRQVQMLDRWICSEGSGRKTLGGAVFNVGASALHVWKEAGRTLPETLKDPPLEGQWDGRFSYVLARDVRFGEDVSLFLGPLGQFTAQSQQPVLPDGWPKAAFACSPAIWAGRAADDPQAVLLMSLAHENEGQSGFALKLAPFSRLLAANQADDQAGDQADP